MKKTCRAMFPLGLRDRARAARSLAGLGIALALSPQAAGEIHKFRLDQPGARNLGIWRLTHDAAIRDEGSYHNIQCWSGNGRYTCHTHWGGDKGPGGKASAEVHVVDLMTGEDRRVDRGINPRWANNHNWLFYCHWTGDGKPPYETGTQVIRYDANTGEKVVITHGMEGPGSLDATDTWLYGVQRYRGRKPEMVTVRVRVRNRSDSAIEPIQGAPNMHGYIHVNPRHPVIMTRAKDSTDKVYGTNRAFFDLDGSNRRQGSVMGQAGHQSWSGDGKYLLIGNRQVCGRPWDKPFPSDLEVLSWGRVGDICPCGKSGRYICGGGLTFVDARSGDAWPVVFPYSSIIYPMAGDHSSLMDIDPKGSPDGTKIHYHSTRDLKGFPAATVTKYDRKKPDVIQVDSTDGFPESGDIVCRWEVVGYGRKTTTTFEGLTRRKYGTRPAPDLVRKVRAIFPLSAFVLPGGDKARAKPDGSMLRAGVTKTNPLLYQRQTDCYVVVTRRPFAPHLRLKRGSVELIPGESHWETRGYRILRDGHPVAEGLLQGGSAFVLDRPAVYTAIAVEWSGLESPPSLPLQIGERFEGRVLKDKPEDFSWTRPVWQINATIVSQAQAMKAPHATMQIEHLHDGVIASEEWAKGQRICRMDLNRKGEPIRRQEFRNAKRTKRIYTTPEGFLASEELYGPDGFKTEYVRYYTRPDRRGQEYTHWWLERGRPVKKTKRGHVEFDTTKEQDARGTK